VAAGGLVVFAEPFDEPRAWPAGLARAVGRAAARAEVDDLPLVHAEQPANAA
jgi:hypothetical protein